MDLPKPPIDNNPAQPIGPTPPRSSYGKVLLVMGGVLILAEIIWAGVNLVSSQNTLKPQSNIPPAKTSSLVQGASISLSAQRTTLRVGEKTEVAITVSNQKPVDGVDVIVNFNPTLVAVENPQKAVQVGTLFSDYPVNSADNAKGVVTLSGISGLTNGVLVNGQIGVVTFVAKSPGVAKITIDFTKGSSKDSNVTEHKTGKDILESVANIDLNITP